MSSLKDIVKSILQEKDAKDGMHVQDITNIIWQNYPETTDNIDRETLLNKINTLLLKESKTRGSDFAKAINPKTHKPKKGVYRLVRRRLADPLPRPITEDIITPQQTIEAPQSVSTNYIGKGGEYAVMSELLFQGYNANIMSVDEGIDIVASKQNIFYYLQVKTTNLSQNLTAHVSIKRSNFDRGLSSQLRYFVVVRCDSGEIRYFKFTEENIIMYSCQGYIRISDDSIHIKIKFGAEDHLPYLYHENKQIEIKYHQNNFSL